MQMMVTKGHPSPFKIKYETWRDNCPLGEASLSLRTPTPLSEVCLFPVDTKSRFVSFTDPCCHAKVSPINAQAVLHHPEFIAGPEAWARVAVSLCISALLCSIFLLALFTYILHPSLNHWLLDTERDPVHRSNRQ